jgi:hypothetical protein
MNADKSLDFGLWTSPGFTGFIGVHLRLSEFHVVLVSESFCFALVSTGT